MYTGYIAYYKHIVVVRHVSCISAVSPLTGFFRHVHAPEEARDG